MITELPGLARRLVAWIGVLLAVVVCRPAVAQVADTKVHVFVLADQLEVAPNREGLPLSIDALSWIGGDLNRLWLRFEAEQETRSANGALQAEAFYGRLVSPFWDALVGVRVDQLWGDEAATRALFAVGFAGLAPYWFEIEPTLYVSLNGDVSAQLEAEYELLLTQRLILQPRLELQLAIQDVPEFGVGSGLSDLELGARLRYEIVREVAPYLGVDWHRRFGATADLARVAGESVSSVSLVAGLRLWY